VATRTNQSNGTSMNVCMGIMGASVNQNRKYSMRCANKDAHSNNCASPQTEATHTRHCEPYTNAKQDGVVTYPHCPTRTHQLVAACYGTAAFGACT
jgi:hypothetical protein